MSQPQPERPAGTRMLTAFGESPEQIRAELDKAFGRFQASVTEHQAHWLVRPAADRWSPAQVAEHVLIVNESVGRVVSLLLQGRPLRAMPEVPGELVEGKRRTPAAQEPGEGQSWEALQSRWQASHALLQEVAGQLEGADLSRRYHHPFLGELDAHDWLRMATFHTRHHRKQLEEGQAVKAQ